MKTLAIETSNPLGFVLREARKKANKLQEEAGEQIGRGRTTIVAIEAGQRKVSAQELEILARFYGTTANDLLAVNDTPQHNDALEHVLSNAAFLSLESKQKAFVLRILEKKPRRVVVRSLQLIGMQEEDLEEIACALLHHLLDSLTESEAAQ